MELGLTTFAALIPGVGDKKPDPGELLSQVIDEAVLADKAGLDIFAIGEHHRPDFAVSAPSVVLGVIAGQTERIRLSPANTVPTPMIRCVCSNAIRHST